MKKISCIIYLLFLYLIGAAQDMKFRYAFGVGGESSSYSRKVVSCNDGSFVCLFQPLPFGTDTCDLDPGPGETLFNGLTQRGSVIAKYNADGTFAWMHDIATASSPSIFEEAFDLVTDIENNIYVTGLFMDSLDFDPGPGKRVLRTKNSANPEANQAAYVCRYDASGNFISAFEIAGLSRLDDAFLRPFLIRTGPDGNIYLCGQVLGNADFDPGSEVATTPQGITTLSGTVYIASYDQDLNFKKLILIGTKNTLSSGGAIQPIDLQIAQGGELYLTGLLDKGGDRDYNPGEGNLALTAKGMDDGLLMKFASNGDYIWGGVFGTALSNQSELDRPVAIRLDEQENIYLAGSSYRGFDADLVPDDEMIVPLDRGGDFIIKYDLEGKVIRTRSFTNCQDGGSNSGRIYDLQYQKGKLYACGSYTCNNDFNPDPGVEDIKSHLAGEDVFVFFCDTSGVLSGVTTFIGTGEERASHILLNPGGEITLLGSQAILLLQGGGIPILSEIDLDPGPGVNKLKSFSQNTGSWFIGRYSEEPRGIEQYSATARNSFKIIRASQGILEILPESSTTNSVSISIYDVSGRLLRQKQNIHPLPGESIILEHVPEGFLIIGLDGETHSSARVWMSGGQ